MNRGQGWLWTGLAILAGVTYQYLVYHAATGAEPAWARLALKALPLLLLAWWVATRARHKMAGMAALLAAGVLLYWLDRQAFGAAAYGIPHAAIYVFLAGLFGHTLAPGHEPLVTRLALRVHGSLSPVIRSYTRNVTLAWTVFCLAQVAVSLGLFCYASRELWSLFITVFNPPLLALMFVAEYVYRVLRYPEHPHASIPDAIRAFTEHTAPAGAPVPPPAGAGAAEGGAAIPVNHPDLPR